MNLSIGCHFPTIFRHYPLDWPQTWWVYLLGDYPDIIDLRSCCFHVRPNKLPVGLTPDLNLTLLLLVLHLVASEASFPWQWFKKKSQSPFPVCWLLEQFPSISGQTAHWIDFRFHGCNYWVSQTCSLHVSRQPGLLIDLKLRDWFPYTKTMYTRLQAWLTIVHVSLNFCIFLASDGKSSFSTFLDTLLMGLTSNLVGLLI